jgi:hypothetical protein
MGRVVDRVVMLCVVALALSCAPSLQVETDFDRRASFRGYHEWSFIDSPRARGGSLGGLDPALRTRIEEVIRGELTSRRFANAEPGGADFYVAYHGGAQDHVTVETYGYSMWAAQGGDVYLLGANSQTHTEGMLVLDIVDAKSRALVWRGTATDVVVNRADAADKVTKAVRRMLDNFPPRSN